MLRCHLLPASGIAVSLLGSLPNARSSNRQTATDGYGRPTKPSYRRIARRSRRGQRYGCTASSSDAPPLTNTSPVGRMVA